MSAARAAEIRALKRLSAAGMAAAPMPGRDDVYAVFPGGDRRRRPLARLPKESIARLVSSGALKRSDGKDEVVITDEGRALLRRADQAFAEPFRAQHLDLAAPPAESEAAKRGGRQINLADSPLAWLARRTDRNGEPFISPRELLAGERLRGDFHRARFIGRVTSDWSAAPRGSTARGPSRAQLDPAEAVVVARDRIVAALRHVGPGLDRLLTAVCLEGRGLDDVERGFGWPKRAGKIVLKIALGRLADHYGLGPDR